MTDRQECKYYEECEAPLCPMHPDAGIWYPNEKICRRVKGMPAWVKQQRKVAQKASSKNFGYYLTMEMLSIPFRVTESIKGLDPDKYLSEEPTQLKNWFKRYKGVGKKKLSPAQIKKKQELAEKARKSKQAEKLINKGSEPTHTYQKMSPEMITLTNNTEVQITDGI